MVWYGLGAGGRVCGRGWCAALCWMGAAVSLTLSFGLPSPAAVSCCVLMLPAVSCCVLVLLPAVSCCLLLPPAASCCCSQGQHQRQRAPAHQQLHWHHGVHGGWVRGAPGGREVPACPLPPRPCLPAWAGGRVERDSRSMGRQHGGAAPLRPAPPPCHPTSQHHPPTHHHNYRHPRPPPPLFPPAPPAGPGGHQRQRARQGGGLVERGGAAV